MLVLSTFHSYGTFSVTILEVNHLYDLQSGARMSLPRQNNVCQSFSLGTGLMRRPSNSYLCNSEQLWHPTSSFTCWMCSNLLSPLLFLRSIAGLKSLGEVATKRLCKLVCRIYECAEIPSYSGKKSSTQPRR